MFNDLIKNVMSLGIITQNDVERLTATELMLLIIERCNGLLDGLIETSDELKKVDAKYQKIMDELRNATEEKTAEILQQMVDDGTMSELINQTALIDLNNRINDLGNQVEMFGAKGDGITDDSDALQQALDNGGVVLLGKDKVYKFTKTLHIRQSNLTVKGNQATLKFVGDGTGIAFLDVMGTSHTDYYENVTLSDFTIDGTEQAYKGGSESNWKLTSPQPRYGGSIGILADYTKNLTIRNLTLNDIYSNGIIVRRSSHVMIDGNRLYDCSGGNIIKNDAYTGHDNFGDGIGTFFCYDVTMSNNTVINNRKYLVSDQTSDVTQVYGQICGRSGLEFEYGLTQNSGQYPPDYGKYSTTDGFGLMMFNNYVEGYTKGIHLEAEVRIDVSKNKILRCHIGILHTEGDESIISENYISNENLGKCPQIGYDAYCGGIALTEYDHPDLTLVFGNRIDLDNENGLNLNAITIGRSNVHLDNNRIKAKRGIIQLRNTICTGNSISVTNNEMIARKDGLFISKYFGGTSWLIANNVFITSDATSGHATCRLHSDIDNPFRTTVVNNWFTNSTLEFSSFGGKNAIVSENTFECNINSDEIDMITLPIGSDIMIKDNYFFTVGSKVKHIIKNDNNSERTTIKGNLVDIRDLNDIIESCFHMSGYQTDLEVSDNTIKTVDGNSGLIMLRVNWSVNGLKLNNNRFVGAMPHENYIMKSDSALINGHIEMNNNNGVVPNAQIVGGLVDRRYYNMGEILHNYVGLAIGQYAGRICVKSGLQVFTQWQPNTSYQSGDVFYQGENVYKVIQAHTSGGSFTANEMVQKIADLPVFEEYGEIK